MTTKITFTAPITLKESLQELKTTYKLKSISAVIEEALKAYKQQKEIERWRKGNEALANDPELIAQEIALSEAGDNTYYEEYE